MRFSKNVLSQHLRAGCDLALYLTLFPDSALAKKGLPTPLEARPGIGSLRDAGFALEDFIFQQLRTAFGARFLAVPPDPGSIRWREQPMADLLARSDSPPMLLAQPRFEIDDFRLSTLTRLGVAQADLDILPSFEALIPDLVIVETPRSTSVELSATGERIQIPRGDHRRSLSIVDIKHASEANPSYEAEVVLYGVLLANWLRELQLDAHYFVSAELSLWTGGGAALGELQRALDDGVDDSDELVAAARKEFSSINVPIFSQAVRRFFSEKLPPVIRTGAQDWRSLDWYVGPACASCDWLGYDGWLSPKDRDKVSKHPDHYCYFRAEETDDLSRLPLTTRGSCRVLRSNGYNTVADVANTVGVEPVYKLHTVLRSEKQSLPAYARAIIDGRSTTNADRTDGGLARYADFDVFVSVNFDPGAGLLTAIGIRARFTQHFPYDERGADRRTQFWHEKWIVSAKSHVAEESALLAFLQYLASKFDYTRDENPERGGPHAANTRTQFVFWDRRQFEELCLALGRHLHAILYDRQERFVRALTWIFPPEDIQETGSIDPKRPGIAFLRDVARRLVRVPALHAFTLHNVVNHYHHPDAPPPRKPDPFYREPLSDMVPRERIYEIWQLSQGGGVSTVQWGSVVKTLNQLLDGFGRAVDQQTRALASVTRQLRGDFGQQLRAQAPNIALTVPTWATGVAHDAKLWIAWSKFERAFDKAKRHGLYLVDPDEAEASHEGLRLTRLVEQREDGEWVFEVSPESLNTKIRAPSDFLCLAAGTIPGFATLPAYAVVSPVPPDLIPLRLVPMHKLLPARLEEFDRVNALAIVRHARFFGQAAHDLQRLRDVVVNRLGNALHENVTLMEGLGTDTLERRLVRILRAVGNPPNAQPAREARAALGTLQRPARAGSSPITPISRVLWDAAALHDEEVRPRAVAQAIADRARALAPLNNSQLAAVRQSVTRGLTVIWGPPGTGKTQTCQALLHSIVVHQNTTDANQPYNILVTGPTYRAVTEILLKLGPSLAQDAGARCKLYLIHSRYRDDRFPAPNKHGPHFQVFSTFAEANEPEFGDLAADINSGSEIVIVAAVAHQCPKMAEALADLDGGSRALRQIFDFAVVDESSQLDMSIAVGPLALLKSSSQLVVVGDHLQMPPVFVADPPIGAEHLIGSLQTYLIQRFGIEPVPLLVNYRSNDDIVAYTRRLGYPGDLAAAKPDIRLHFLASVDSHAAYLADDHLAVSDGWSTVLDPSTPIVAVTYPDGMAGQANSFEADCVASIARLLYQTGSCSLDGKPGNPGHAPWADDAFWTEGLGIVTPHRAQRAQVVQSLLQAFPTGDPDLIESAVDTVERFQGSERHTTIISFGVGDPDVIRGEERFLLQLERTNVAISRAMAKCVVFISDEVANHIPDDRRAAATAHALKGIVDEWCIHRAAHTVSRDGYQRQITVRWR
ncbi:MAG: AAA domain-containing protein [Immundisolibacterales bacterium]|nr:AAA domain-containing protein [Immundisolibacterales bacterium]